MTQDNVELDAVIRARIRGLRRARGWSLDALAARCHLSPSTLSRIETGHRRISVDQLVEPVDDADVVIRPRHDLVHGTVWLLSRDDGPHGLTVAKMRITGQTRPKELRVHPGRDWFTVLSGTIRLYLGERIILVAAGQAAQFSTMAPHAFVAHDGPAEVLTILDHEGQRAHLDAVDLTPEPPPGSQPESSPPG
jgi:transcriptional regulator with XRE-family HTH domain